ncbi:hypothetical protein LY474_10295 [Myxococcus stipitatus]|uniref:hypothetical protein n=1 Tax=Myxococcus stipitatus TaxID=83455 RepID=UPI001F2201BB|nr:hypothetical protein [Myxococcus stipitatus]MCE9668203.1 hypothetical protein [Myxococcus stipitatus]
MRSLGRLAVMCGLLSLVGCGPEAPVAETQEGAPGAESQVSANVDCPQIVLPGPGFCENGTITPVYVGGCIVRYTCTL